MDVAKLASVLARLQFKQSFGPFVCVCVCMWGLGCFSFTERQPDKTERDEMR